MATYEEILEKVPQSVKDKGLVEILEKLWTTPCISQWAFLIVKSSFFPILMEMSACYGDAECAELPSWSG